MRNRGEIYENILWSLINKGYQFGHADIIFGLQDEKISFEIPVDRFNKPSGNLIIHPNDGKVFFSYYKLSDFRENQFTFEADIISTRSGKIKDVCFVDKQTGEVSTKSGEPLDKYYLSV